MGERRDVQRAVLPIPDRVQPGLTTYDAKDPDAKFPPIRELRPPEGAPNVLVILLDDVGFGASSAFGGQCETPVAERLARGGCGTTAFTPRRCARRRARRCSVVATTVGGYGARH
jgi:arylsulfatase